MGYRRPNLPRHRHYHPRQRQRPLTLGTCTDITYETTDNGHIAITIESDEPLSCQETPDEGTHLQLYGLLDSFPDNDLGPWVIFVAIERGSGTEISRYRFPVYLLL
ncbi:MAG TPA: hypothetical protein VLL52_17575 [Anaerolineae bacterium]|nr:hypothetical protein [Anaerolineae bacterium]